MSRSKLRAIVLAAGFFARLGSDVGWGEEPAAPQPEAAVAADEAAIRATLERLVSVDVAKMPLRQFAAAVQRDCGIPVLLDEQQLKDEGVSPDEPLTLRASHIRLKSALRLVLEPQQLRAVVWEGRLRITTIYQTVQLMTTRAYDVSDLLGGEINSDKTLKGLIEIVREHTGGVVDGYYNWHDEDEEDHGKITPQQVGDATLLLIRQTDVTHGQVRRLLRDIRAAIATPGASQKPVQPQPAAAPQPAIEAGIHFATDNAPHNESRIRAALERRVSMHIDQLPLRDFIRQLERTCHGSVVMNTQALEDEQVPLDDPISIDADGITLRSALELALAPSYLIATLHDEVLYITTAAEGADTDCRVYNVTDLVPNRQANLAGAKAVKDLIYDTVGRDGPYGAWWQEFDGSGDSTPISSLSTDTADLVIVNQTAAVHRQIDELLKKVRAANAAGDVMPVRHAD